MAVVWKNRKKKKPVRKSSSKALPVTFSVPAAVLTTDVEAKAEVEKKTFEDTSKKKSIFPDYAGLPNGLITIGTTSTRVLYRKENRRIAAIVNDSSNTVYLSLGPTAVMNGGIRLNANGGSFTFGIQTDFKWCGEVYGIASGNSNITVVES